MPELRLAASIVNYGASTPSMLETLYHRDRMMLVEIPRGNSSDKRAPGTWWPVIEHTPEPEFRPYWSALVFCPDCRKPLTCKAHSIAQDGQVTPSLGHPVIWAACGWHVTPRLLGWEAHNWPLPPVSNPETCAKCGKVSHTIGGWGTWQGGIICHECFG